MAIRCRKGISRRKWSRYADDGKRSWGDELKSIKFASSPGLAAINEDRTLFAVSVDCDIHLFDAEFDLISVLRGHTHSLSALAFRPGQPKALVSCAEDASSNDTETNSTILVWDLKDRASDGRVIDDSDIKSISYDAVESVRDSLAMLKNSFDLASSAQETLSEAFRIPIAQSIARSSAERCRTLHGDLASSFQSNIFSPSGKFLIYKPGRRPISNSDDQWDLKVRSLEDHEDILTLSGHRDAIMWTGYDKAEKLIGSAAWDKTFRIWDAETGQEKYKFQTSNQNWTAGFSPDNKMFAGTSGNGDVHVYSLDDGSKLLQLNHSKRWCRALDWAPDSKTLAIGGGLRGKIILIDIEKKEVTQERILSAKRVKTDDETTRDLFDRVFPVTRIKFADRGRKLVFWTNIDSSAEAYDLAAGTKWRFARQGTESYQEDWRDDEKTVVEGESGRDTEVWEEPAKGRVMVATVDYDAVRIWSLKMESTNSSAFSG